MSVIRDSPSKNEIFNLYYTFYFHIFFKILKKNSHYLNCRETIKILENAHFFIFYLIKCFKISEISFFYIHLNLEIIIHQL